MGKRHRLIRAVKLCLKATRQGFCFRCSTNKGKLTWADKRLKLLSRRGKAKSLDMAATLLNARNAMHRFSAGGQAATPNRGC
ncbi:hypothetical protein SRHO_G00018390 [Serrasalmus rhombeus]